VDVRRAALTATVALLIAIVAAPGLQPRGNQVHAQTADADPYTKAAKQQFDRIHTLVARAAAKAGDDVYAFKPTPEVRTFASVVGHIADGNILLCTAASGVKPTITREHEKKTSKTEIIAALEQSKAFCDRVLATMTDASGATLFAAFGGAGQPRLSWIHSNNSHVWEHYGNLVTYLRLKGIVPPSSEG
jgi:hypothetical protein